MEWIWFILTLLLSGLIVGGLGRLVVPGRETVGIFGTALAGVGGSFLGGFIGRLLFGPLEWWAALLLAVAGAALLVAPFSMRGRRTITY